MVNKKLIDKYSWEEIIELFMKRIGTKSPGFKKFMQDRESYKGTFFDAFTWYQQYKIWKEVNNSDDDYVEIITGQEGSGKSTLAKQKAAVVDPTFETSRIFNDPKKLFQWLLDNQGKTKGKAIQIDEGNLFLFSRQAMRKDNVDVVKLFTIVRQANLYILICVPNIKTIDTYIKEHRAKSWVRIIKKHEGFMYYNKKALNMVVNLLKKGKTIGQCRIPYDCFYSGSWNNEMPYINNLRGESYKNLKDDAYKEFLKDCVDKASENKSTFVSVSDVSKELGLGLSTINKHIHDGKIPAHKLGEKWLIPRNYLEKMKNLANVGTDLPINGFNWKVE